MAARPAVLDPRQKPEAAAPFAAMLGSAPRLAEAIVQRPHLLDGFIDCAIAFRERKRLGASRAGSRRALQAGTSHEDALDLLRDAGREEWFMAGARFLGGGSDAARLGAAYTAVAEASLQVALDITQKGFAADARHGQRLAPCGDGIGEARRRAR